jgi:phosphomethylpyrimidine synthase
VTACFCGLSGWEFCLMEVCQGMRRDAVAQNDAGGSLLDAATAEAGMAEMSAKFRAGSGVVEVKL